MKITKFLEEHKGTAYTCSEIYKYLNKKAEPQNWGDVALLVLYCLTTGKMAMDGKIKSHYAGGDVYYYI